MQVHPLLVLEADSLCVGVRVEGVHQDQWDVAVVLVVDILGEEKTKEPSRRLGPWLRGCPLLTGYNAMGKRYQH